MYLNPYIEFLVRFVNFKLGGEIFFRKLKKLRKSNVRKKITLFEIEKLLKEYGIKKGDHVIIHSSLSAISARPEEIIDFFKSYIGFEGAILMPTHPKLIIESSFEIYDPDNSTSSVGYLTECFRKSEGVKRSLHPYSSVAVWGKYSKWYLEYNLNQESPLPHGKFSPYFKLSQKNGTAICIGVSAKDRATIKHVAEEFLDERFPVRNMFEENIVRIKQGESFKEIKVRRVKLKLSQLFIAKHKIRKEWLENGILKEFSLKGVPIHFVDCKKCVDIMIEGINKGNTSYPFASKK